MKQDLIGASLTSLSVIHKTCHLIIQYNLGEDAVERNYILSEVMRNLTISDILSLEQYLVWNVHLVKLAWVGVEGRHMAQLMGHLDPSDHQDKEGVQFQL